MRAARHDTVKFFPRPPHCLALQAVEEVQPERVKLSLRLSQVREPP